MAREDRLASTGTYNIYGEKIGVWTYWEVDGQLKDEIDHGDD